MRKLTINLTQINEAYERHPELYAPDHDISNENINVRYIYVIYDHVSQADSDPMYCITRSQAIRSFTGYLTQLPPHIQYEDFSLHIIGVFDHGDIIPVGRVEVISGGELRSSPPKEEINDK